jgi:two-component system phosphate regulon sensor histidine kinase PhoR
MRLSRADWTKLAMLALLLLVPCGLATWSLAARVHEFTTNALEKELIGQAELLREAISDRSADAGRFDRWRQRLEKGDVQVELLDGSFANDASEGGGGRVVASIRTDDGRILRLSRAAAELFPIFAPAALSAGVLIATVVTLALLAAATVIAFLRRRIVRRLVRGVRDLSAGKLNAEVRIDGSHDLARLADSVDAVRQRLAGHVKTIDQQRHTLDSLVRQLREGLIVLRDDNRVRLINPAAVRLLNAPGASADYVGGPVHRCLSPEAMRALALFPGEPEVESPRQRRIRVVAPDGERTLLADIWSVELPEGDATPRARVLVLTDISRLERAMKVRTDFVANASHELRTPLSTIRAAVDTLLTIDFRAEPGQAERFLRTIDRHTTRLEELVTDLLDLSRLESSEARFEHEPLQVAGEVEALRVRHATRLKDSALQWRTRIEPADDGAFLANPHLLRLVLDNLVDNAAKFTQAGGSITVSVERANGHVSFLVADTGLGIAAAEQPRVFERFYQVGRDRFGRARGTGLGLSIVRHAVSVMGGSVSLESELGRGTTVTVMLPQDGRHRDPIDTQ